MGRNKKTNPVLSSKIQTPSSLRCRKRSDFAQKFAGNESLISRLNWEFLHGEAAEAAEAAESVCRLVRASELKTLIKASCLRSYTIVYRLRLQLRNHCINWEASSFTLH